MRSLDLLPMRVSSGSKDIGHRRVIITSGSEDIGNILRLKGHTGCIRITTTIVKAGNATKGIGTTRITTTVIGASMIMGGIITITTITTTTAINR